MKLEAANRLRSTPVEAGVKDSLKTFVGAFALCAKAYAELNVAGKDDISQIPSKRKARDAARKALGVAGSAFEADLIASIKEAGFPKVKPTSMKVSKISLLGMVGAHYGAEVAPKCGVAVYLKYSDNTLSTDSPVTAFVYVKGKAVAKYESKAMGTYKNLPKVIKPADILKAISPALVSLGKGDYKELK